MRGLVATIDVAEHVSMCALGAALGGGFGVAVAFILRRYRRRRARGS